MKKNKNAAKSLLCFTLASVTLFLSSCSFIPGYVEPEDQYVVSAIGFDATDGEIAVSVEVIDSDPKKSRVLNGEGASIEEAISALLSGETKTLEVSHCAMIALGKGIGAEWLRLIMDYCNRNEDITVAAHVVAASDARSLLSISDVSGYDLVSSISEGRENSGVGRESRFYQVEGARSSDDPVFALPYFTASGENFELYGVRIYGGDEPRVSLDRAESAYYMMIRGLFGGGLLGRDSPGLSGSVGVSDCKVKYEFSEVDGKPALKVSCKIKLDGELADDRFSDEIVKATKEGMERVFNELSPRYGDVFKLTQRAKKQRVDVADGFFERLTVSFECSEV